MMNVNLSGLPGMTVPAHQPSTVERIVVELNLAMSLQMRFKAWTPPIILPEHKSTICCRAAVAI